jgi:curved DNA-binding protein CbpA
MTFQGDPYRTLGVSPGASSNEIRSAYRRLAKQYHPDFAGERALPRFLAIQAAYELLVDGEGRLRPGGGSGGGRSGGGRSGGAAGGGRPGEEEPWRADPGRARASRDAWRARRSGSGGTWGYRAGPTSGRPTGSGSSSASSSSSTSSSSSGRPGSGPDRTRRAHRSATPGSTSYDEARETPLDPEWDGGAWYGPSSGTYWTLNPREYADPRKHGPEYLERARRASAAAWRARGTGGAAGAAPGATPGGEAGTFDGRPPRTEGTAEGAGWAWSGSGQTRTDGSGTAWTRRSWTFEARDDGAEWTPGPESRAHARTERAGWGPGPVPGSRPGARAEGRGAHMSPPGPVDRQRAAAATALPPPDLEALVRRLFPEHLLRLSSGPDWRWRVLVALVAWPPIGYALGGLVSAATGCARFSAACPEPVPVLLLLAQPLIVLGLWAARPVAAVAASAALAALAVAIPAGAILSVGALPRPVVEPLVLGIVVGIGYAVAFTGGAWRLIGARREPTAGP